MLKTFTFAVVHFTVAFTVAYLLTGSVITGGLIALVEPMVNTVAYYFHERAWQRFGSERSPQKGLGHGNFGRRTIDK
ncbi:DUF2061 domain-containing protein [Pseudomonas sp. gcc21]|uniref:DUF2061 domain-containing protein n=1 Tax=Pseudomonas sp. gcc21 TaxID=2726989 RepID=UPI001452768E|nr:DUF2061 domain-containing protein [Pseudomonas sp. gcc21]QJD57544.1 DUF2061 domain-containing protein [Pseudomonas sp. gcc21]